MNKTFDFKNIKSEDKYIGDIILVKRINKKVLEKCKKADIIIGDLSGACKILEVKKNAILIKVSNKYYIDIDTINSLRDCDYINYCLENNIKDKRLLRHGTFNPYVGQLFIRKLRSCSELKKSTDILELKFTNNKK